MNLSTTRIFVKMKNTFIMILIYVSFVKLSKCVLFQSKSIFAARRYPYQVSIRFAGEHICGGVIIQRTAVLTAAHCVHNRKPSTLSIRVGSDFRTKAGNVVPIGSYRIHPKFDQKWLSSDIAIIYLKTALSFNSKISAIPLSVGAVPDGVLAVASGWGVTKEGGGLSDRLRTIQLRTVSKQKCRQVYGKVYSPSTFCAINVREGRDTCQGDSGGPLVYNNQLIGITSHGNGCGRKGWPGIYTAIRHFRRWINELT